MPITVNCACGKQYPVKEEFAGQRIKCPDCGQVLTIPGTKKNAPSDANGHTKPNMSTGSVSTLNDFQLDELDELDDATPMVRAPKKKGGKGMVFAVLGCGCLMVVLGTAALAAGGGAWYMGAFDGLFASNDTADATTDKGKDKPVDPNKDNPVDPNKDNPVDPNKDKQPVDPNKDKPIDRPLPEGGPWKGHQAGIVALRFTNDHKYAVTAAGGMEDAGGRTVLAPDNSVRLWNVADGSSAKILNVFTEGIAVSAISPDGRYAAVVYPGQLKDGAWVKGSDHVIHVWDLQAKPAPKEMPPLRGHTDTVWCLAFKKNGAQLLSGGADHSVRLWNIRDGSPQRDPFLGHAGTITAVAFDPKNARAVSCSSDKTIRMWDLEAEPGANQLLYEFKGHQDIVWTVAFSDDGKHLLTAGGMQIGPTGGYIDGAKDTEIRLWDVTDLKDIKEVKRFKGTNKAVTCVAFSPDGRRIISGGYDNLVRLWHVSTGQELVNFPGHTDIVRGVAFFPDGKRALSGSDDSTLRAWELPPDVPDIIANLASPDLKVKQQAVQDLYKFGEEAKPAVPALIKCLALGDAGFKQQVIALLRQLGGAPGREDAMLLATMAADKTFPDGRLYAVEALATLGADAKPALAVLQDMLKENDVVLKRKAIVVIGQIGPDARNAVFTQFVEFLRDPDAETAKAAGEALPKLGRPAKEQVSVLGHFLSDTNENVRKYALTALADLGADAEPELPRIVAMVRLDKSPELRKAAMTTVLKLKPKDTATVDVMVVALRDTDSGVCLQAMMALAEIGPSNGALPAMLQALEHKDEAVRKAAEEAFSQAAFDKTHVKALSTVLRINKSVAVRARVVDVLAKLGPDAADAAEDLGRVAKDSEGDLRVKAIATLGLLGPAGKKGAPLLVEVLADKNERSDDVRIEVAIALTKMNAPEAKQAVPLLIKGLLVTDSTDAKQIARQEKVTKILIDIGGPAADPLARTIGSKGDFYNSKINTKEGAAASAARRRVLEILIAMGKKANTGGVLLALANAAKEDPDGEVRKFAQQVYRDIQ